MVSLINFRFKLHPFYKARIQKNDKEFKDPENGFMVIVGGAMQSEAIIKPFYGISRWVKTAAIVVIPDGSGAATVMYQNSGFAGRLRGLRCYQC